MRRKIEHLLVIIWLVAAAVACQQAAPLVPVTAHGAVSGAVELRRGGTLVWVPGFDQVVLYVGDTVRAKEAAEITFLEQIVVKLEPGTELEVVAAEDGALQLASDSASVALTDAQAAIQLAPRGAAIQVRAGEARVAARGESQLVGAGQAWQVGTVLPAEPTRMAASPSPTCTTAVIVARASVTPQATASPTKQQPTATSTKLVAPTSTPRNNGAAATPVPSVMVRVNCGGGQARDGKGRLWAADKPYAEGDWGHMGGKVYTTGNAIANTESDILFQSERWGDFYYLFDIPNGTYHVTLLFAELYRDNPNERQFGVRLEGNQVISQLDLAAVAGRDVAHVLKYTIALQDGQFGVEVIQQMGDPKINGIMLERLQ